MSIHFSQLLIQSIIMENNFKDNFKQLRKDSKLTQQQMSLALNTTVKTISHWETGYTEPSINQILEIADFFTVSLEELLK